MILERLIWPINDSWKVDTQIFKSICGSGKWVCKFFKPINDPGTISNQRKYWKMDTQIFEPICDSWTTRVFSNPCNPGKVDTHFQIYPRFLKNGHANFQTYLRFLNDWSDLSMILEKVDKQIFGMYIIQKKMDAKIYDLLHIVLNDTKFSICSQSRKCGHGDFKYANNPGNVDIEIFQSAHNLGNVDTKFSTCP